MVKESFQELGGLKMPQLLINSDMLIKLLLSCVLGGLIGLERESVNRPAGFRTHMLVCVGATLVMMINAIMITAYGDAVNLDPGRFGAAVISGIGFLGAGTIIKEGNSVKGLTTAASLWTVACIGIAIGAGYFAMSAITTLTVLIILEVFARMEKSILRKRRQLILRIVSENTPGQIGKIGDVTGFHKCLIQDIDLDHQSDRTAVITIALKFPKGFDLAGLIDDLSSLGGMHSVEQVTPLYQRTMDF